MQWCCLNVVSREGEVELVVVHCNNFQEAHREL